LAVAQVLVREGYITAVQVVPLQRSCHLQIELYLKYTNAAVAATSAASPSAAPAIREIRRVSKPSRRVYTRIDQLRPSYSGLGIHVLSTSQGIMSSNEARRRRLGGEVLGEVF